ncbi:PREDICTED: C-C motif chemokine 3-like [Tinamus guttatus]|uniref:C-C motif chemokine 3-like n=1 Tax=Tinamus guttatus TaxID=94827 RepID=UPI00052EA0EB|nr:PREDICTED: C-C motif chemokine 3-like [Tinamus guttatus]
MKVFSLALVSLLLGALWTEAQGKTYGVPTSCCFSYQSKPVPRGIIASAYVTSSSCTQPGVIFVTKKKQEICADPQVPWVRAHLKHFHKKQD